MRLSNKFTMGKEKAGIIPFLDVLVIKEGISLNTKVQREHEDT